MTLGDIAGKTAMLEIECLIASAALDPPTSSRERPSRDDGSKEFGMAGLSVAGAVVVAVRVGAGLRCEHANGAAEGAGRDAESAANHRADGAGR